MKCTCAGGHLSPSANNRKTALLLHILPVYAPPRNCAAAHSSKARRKGRVTGFGFCKSLFCGYLQTLCKCVIVSMAQNEIVQVTDTKRHFVSLFSVTWKVLCQQSEILHAGRVSERRHAFFTPCKRGKQSIMAGKNNPNEKKRLIGLLVASISPIVIVVATLFSLFGWLFRFELQS